MDQFFQIFPLRPATRAPRFFSVAALFVALLIWNQNTVAAAVSTCVVKLQFSSSDAADSGTNTFVKNVLSDEGYKVIDEWLFTIWSHSDYDVRVIISHTETPNYGFPVNLMGIQLYIADGSGKVIVNNYVDRANLEATLRAFVPVCSALPPSNATGAAAGQEVNAQQ